MLLSFRPTQPFSPIPLVLCLWEPCNKQDTGTSDLISFFSPSLSVSFSPPCRFFPFSCCSPAYYRVVRLLRSSNGPLCPPPAFPLPSSLFMRLSLPSPLLLSPFDLFPFSNPPLPLAAPAFSLSRFNVVFFCFPPLPSAPRSTTHLSTSSASASPGDLLSRAFPLPRSTVLLSRWFFFYPRERDRESTGKLGNAAVTGEPGDAEKKTNHDSCRAKKFDYVGSSWGHARLDLY